MADAPTPELVHFSVHYDWVMYHENPPRTWEAVARKGYESFTLIYHPGKNTHEAWLKSQFGPGRPGKDFTVHGHFVHRTNAVEWYRELPDWALPQASGGVMHDYLCELAAMLKIGASYSDIQDFGSRPPTDSGIAVTGKLNKDDFWLEFKPAAPAIEIARVFGLNPIASSGDVHQSSWKIRGTLGPWSIEIGLTKRPTGSDVPNSFATKELAAADLARTLRLQKSP